MRAKLSACLAPCVVAGACGAISEGDPKQLRDCIQSGCMWYFLQFVSSCIMLSCSGYFSQRWRTSHAHRFNMFRTSRFLAALNMYNLLQAICMYSRYVTTWKSSLDSRQATSTTWHALQANLHIMPAHLGNISQSQTYIQRLAPWAPMGPMTAYGVVYICMYMYMCFANSPLRNTAWQAFQ